MHAAGNGS
jgi:hypothetical protein